MRKIPIKITCPNVPIRDESQFSHVLQWTHDIWDHKLSLMKLLLLKDGPSWPLNHFKCLPHVRLLTFLTARHKCSVFNKHVLNYLITSRTKSLVVEQGGSWMIDYRITIFSLQLSGNRCLFQSSSTAPSCFHNCGECALLCLLYRWSGASTVNPNFHISCNWPCQCQK